VVEGTISFFRRLNARRSKTLDRNSIYISTTKRGAWRRSDTYRLVRLSLSHNMILFIERSIRFKF